MTAVFCYSDGWDYLKNGNERQYTDDTHFGI